MHGIYLSDTIKFIITYFVWIGLELAPQTLQFFFQPCLELLEPHVNLVRHLSMDVCKGSFPGIWKISKISKKNKKIPVLVFDHMEHGLLVSDNTAGLIGGVVSISSNDVWFIEYNNIGLTWICLTYYNLTWICLTYYNDAADIMGWQTTSGWSTS